MKRNHTLILTALLATGAQGANLSGTNGTTLEWGSVGTVQVTQGPTTVFPSLINFAGVDVNEVITDVSVTLPGGSHGFADDLEITLEFGGIVIDLFRDVGGNDNIAGSLIFLEGSPVVDDLGSGGLDQDFSGTFDVSVDLLSARETTAPSVTGSGLSAFDGLSPNGDWNLYMFDDGLSATGSFPGWSIDITTETVPEPSAILLLSGAGLLALRRRR